jgi:Tfp pilus assembly protein PilE
MICQPCGQDNASSALFCTACRRPLVAQSKLPSRIEARAQPAMAAAAPAMAAPSYGGDAADAASSRNRFAPPNAERASRMPADAGVLTEEDAWAAVIGDSNTHYYMNRFEAMRHGGNGGWHWPGFFVTWYWMLYRKMWTAAAIWFVAPYVYLIALLAIGFKSPALVGFGVLAGWVVHLLLPGIMANKWYYNQCLRRIRDARARGGSNEQVLARIEAAGGTSNVLVIILAIFGIIFVLGILSAVSLPAYQQYTIKAKVSEAIPLGYEVAEAVGKTYEQTGQLPGQADVDNIVLHSTHRSRYVSGIDLDGTSGTLTVKLNVMPRGDGSIQFVPSSDNNRHLSWTCTAPADMQHFVPASCRGQGR